MSLSRKGERPVESAKRKRAKLPSRAVGRIREFLVSVLTSRSVCSRRLIGRCTPPKSEYSDTRPIAKKLERSKNAKHSAKRRAKAPEAVACPPIPGTLLVQVRSLWRTKTLQSRGKSHGRDPFLGRSRRSPSGLLRRWVVKSLSASILIRSRRKRKSGP